MNAPEAPLRIKKRPRASSRWSVLTLAISAALPKTATAVMLRGSVSRRFAAPVVTRVYSGPGGCTGCTSAEELLDGTALSPGHASGPLSTSTSTSLVNGSGGCTGCSSAEEQETSFGGTAKSQRHTVNRLLSIPTATSLYSSSSSSVSDCTGCTSSDEAGQESSSDVATVSVSPTVAPTSVTIVSAFTSSSATATLISGGSDDSDDDQDDGDEEDSSSAIEVMTPANGEVICPDNEIEVIWTWGEVEIDTFHVGLHDCGQDACCHDCGEFIRALCAEEGCHDCGTIANAESFDVPQDLEGTGPYYRIVVSADDGSYENGCSGTFTIEGNVHTSGDDVESNEPSSTEEENSTGGDSSHETDTDEGHVVLGSCDSFDAIPYPLSEDMEVYVGSGVTELVCATPKTVHVGGGVLTIVATEETIVFGGIRFEVESAAVLLFSEETATEFTGGNNLQIDGGVFKVAENAKVDIQGPVSFQNNSVQATPDGPHHGGAIYSQGSVRLRGGVTFADNMASGDDDGHEAGDGGAVWNGPTARMMVGSTAVLRSNAVGVGGRGGALWNEGFVEFDDEAIFALNQATSSGDDENDGGIGGGIYNREGLVRFKGNATFVGNYAQGGAAFVNSGEGKIKFQEDTSVVGNISNEEDGSVAGAVWNQKDGVVSSKGTAFFVGNRGYKAGAMLNEGEVTFRAGVGVQENSAVMDGGGFINEIGAKIVFHDGGAFRANIGNGSAGAILNMGRLVFKVDEGQSYTLDFEDNYCGDHVTEAQCCDIQSVSGSEVSGLDDVEDLCEIGNQEIVG